MAIHTIIMAKEKESRKYPLKHNILPNLLYYNKIEYLI